MTGPTAYAAEYEISAMAYTLPYTDTYFLSTMNPNVGRRAVSMRAIPKQMTQMETTEIW